MSSYIRQTKHPITGYWEEASWLDDYFGSHSYGVKFPSSGKVFRADDYEWETRDTPLVTGYVQAVEPTPTLDKDIHAPTKVEGMDWADGFDRLCIVNKDGDCKYWNPQAFGYSLHDNEAPLDKFFPEQVKDFIRKAISTAVKEAYERGKQDAFSDYASLYKKKANQYEKEGLKITAGLMRDLEDIALELLKPTK